jgi:ketosteroid isomerase-like protein
LKALQPSTRGSRRYSRPSGCRAFNLQPGALEEHGGDIAVEHGNWSATFAPRDGSPGMPAGGTYLTVYARLADGSVRMIRDAFNGMPGNA